MKESYEEKSRRTKGVKASCRWIKRFLPALEQVYDERRVWVIMCVRGGMIRALIAINRGVCFSEYSLATERH